MRNYTYRLIQGTYEIGYWENREWHCVQTASTYEEILEFLVEKGIT